MTLTVVGVDGARGGWVVAELCEASGPSIRFEPSISSVTNRLRLGTLAAAVIDMPIGLSLDGVRPADTLARARLGERRSTFFPTPVHAVLEHDSWEAANAASRSASGKGLSKQAWNLVPKIRELDTTWSEDISGLLLEGHPEVSFAQMAGTPVLSKKATADGQHERIELLIANLSRDAGGVVDNCPRSWRVDAVDALAIAWTAKRFVNGEALHLGGQIGAKGRPMQLVI